MMANQITDSHIEKVLNRFVNKIVKEDASIDNAENMLSQLAGIIELLIISDHPALSKSRLACHEIENFINEKKK